MTVEFQNTSPSAKADGGRWKILSLIALYLVLAVVVGAARGELRDTPKALSGSIAQQAASSAG